MVIGEYGNYADGSNVRPSMETVAREVGFSSRQKIYPHLKILRERGYLTPAGTRSAKGVVVYRLTAPAEIVRTASATSLDAAVRAGTNGQAAEPVQGEEGRSNAAPNSSAAPAGEPVQLTMEQKMWFLGGSSPEEWPWPNIPYSTAERAYRKYTGQPA